MANVVKMVTGAAHGPRGPVPGTVNDDQDMRRMNKMQELNVSARKSPNLFFIDN